MTTDLDEADGQFAERLDALFRKIPLLPDDVIVDIEHCETAEDGQTLIVEARTENGGTLYVTFMPGKPLGVMVLGPDGKQR